MNVKVGDYIVDQFRQEYKILSIENAKYDTLNEEETIYGLQFTQIDRKKYVLNTFIKTCKVVKGKGSKLWETINSHRGLSDG